MSDTPRTDEKAQFFGFNPDEGEEFVTASFCRELERENAALRSRCDELEAERTQFANRAARLFAIEHELEESRKAERLARVQLQSEREARK